MPLAPDFTFIPPILARCRHRCRKEPGRAPARRANRGGGPVRAAHQRRGGDGDQRRYRDPGTIFPFNRQLLRDLGNIPFTRFVSKITGAHPMSRGFLKTWPGPLRRQGIPGNQVRGSVRGSFGSESVESWGSAKVMLLLSTGSEPTEGYIPTFRTHYNKDTLRYLSGMLTAAHQAG